jgi:hypothetical protein
MEDCVYPGIKVIPIDIPTKHNHRTLKSGRHRCQGAINHSDNGIESEITSTNDIIKSPMVKGKEKEDGSDSSPEKD